MAFSDQERLDCFHNLLIKVLSAGLDQSFDIISRVVKSIGADLDDLYAQQVAEKQTEAQAVVDSLTQSLQTATEDLTAVTALITANEAP